jgi:hypothetical protein
MKNFDTFIAIDWSGAKSPIYTKSISVAKCDFGVTTSPQLIDKKWSRSSVSDYIEDLINQKNRILIGIDCNFGYAQEIIQKQIGKDAMAHDLWALVDRINHNQPNFFAGNFWAHEDYKHDFWTDGKMDHGFQMPRRITETQCADKGYGIPESPFKLIGAKQVGKGGLSGMRMAHYLKQKYKNDIAIWPFDDPNICNSARIVITEIYPRQFIRRVGLGNQKIRTTDDLNTALSTMNSDYFNDHFDSDHDSDAIIAAVGLRYLCGHDKNIPKKISTPHENRISLGTEGWIFGV